MERLRVRSTGTISNFGCNSQQMCRVLELPSTMLGSYSTAFSSGAYDNVGNLTYTGTNISSAFSISGIKKHGNLTANNVTSNGFNYLRGCEFLEEMGDITMLTATLLSTFLGSVTGTCPLRKVGVINAPLCQNLQNFAAGNGMLAGLEFVNCAAVTNTSDMVQNCGSLYYLIMPNLTRGVNLSTTSMDNYGMNLFANSIGIASGGQNMTVTTTPFGTKLAALDATAVAIAAVITGKGYGIIN
jgi:hypothetical protein